jgi:hypothetical protein
LLSPRLLHFGKNQVFWDCATTSACETFPEGLPQALDTGSNDRYWRWKLQDSSDLNEFLPTIVDDSLEQFWRNAIKIYTSCDLSFGQDKLIAIWGIAKFLIGALKETYGVGLWERNLEEQLAWRVVGCQRSGGRPSERPTPLRAPSWSWASIDGVVDLPDRFTAVRDYQVVGHDGKQVAFALEESWSKKIINTDGPRTWTEQLKEYEFRLDMLDERRRCQNIQAENNQTIQNQHTIPPPFNFSAMPGLAQDSIPIWGHIGSGYLRQVRLKAGWALEVPRLHRDSDVAVIEVFPDVYPTTPRNSTLFLILAMNVIQSEGLRKYKRDGQDETREPLPREPTLNDSFSETKSLREQTLLGHDDDVAEKFSGVGILLEAAESPGRFYRTGALRFEGMTLEALQATFITSSEELGFEGEYDEERGHKIWLV